MLQMKFQEPRLPLNIIKTS